MLKLLRNINSEFILSKVLVFADKMFDALLILIGTQITVLLLKKLIFSKKEKSQPKVMNQLQKILPVDRTLFPILRGIITTVLYAVGISLSLERLGIISRNSILALFGSLGLGLGFALKDIASNTVSGIILLLSRPFKLNDYIECKGISGIVKEITVLNTKLETEEGVLISIPNVIIYTNPISNYTLNPIRRITIPVSVPQTESLEKIRDILQRVLCEDIRFLKNPLPQIIVANVQNTSAEIHLQAWVLTENYYDTYYDSLQKLSSIMRAS